MPPGPLFNPFPGLRPFEPDEDHLFFGREKQIDELLRRLRSCRFLAVIGSSGSGKSSLIRSGLIPSLQSGFMAKAGSSWRIATLRPGEDPAGNLAAALNLPDVLGANTELGSTNRVLLEATLQRGTLGLVQAVRQARIPPHDNVLVVVDQFEELFRFRQNRQAGSSRDEAVAFVKLLLEAAQQEHVSIYVVVTMRSDFIGECMEFAGLPEAINNGQYLVPRMTRDELRSAITGPVAVGGAEITPRLILRLLNEVGNDHDQLPILQHALMRTWDDWQRDPQAGPIDVAHYEAIGTMRQALSLHAEEAYQETVSGQREKIVERMFKALTDTFSDPRGIRRPTSTKQLAAVCETSESDVIEVAEIFRRPGRSFLMPPPAKPLDSRSIIDISHESLMRCWSRLIAWAEEERLSARAYARVSQAAAWFEEGTADLWHNPELELGLRWKRENHPTAAWAERYNSSFARAMDFLDRSEKERDRIEAERERERKNKLRFYRVVAGALGTLLVLAVIALTVAYFAFRESRRADANLYRALRTADEIMSSIGQLESAGNPQMSKLQKNLLEEMNVFYTSIANQKTGDEEVRRGSATALSRMGDIDRLLGNYEKAMDEYKNAITRFEKLERDYRGKPEYRQALARAHNYLGETLRLWSEETHNVPERRSQARREYDSALRLQQVLHQEQPQNAKYQQELARTYYNRGIIRFDTGDLKASESDIGEAIQLLEPLVENGAASKADEGGDPPSDDLARAYNDLSQLLTNDGEIAKAQGLMERAIPIEKKLAMKDPGNSEYRSVLAIFYNNLSFQAFEKNDIEMAKHLNHEALDTVEGLSTPSAAIEKQRAMAHMFHLILGPSDHPEFHVLYGQLANEYLGFAEQYLNSGNPGAARLALSALEKTLPEVGEPDRTRLRKSYRDLENKLQESEKRSK
ncbi:MAG: tetratricopeptide repeat protein [Candidatus Acidiferrales bacterium]